MNLVPLRGRTWIGDVLVDVGWYGGHDVGLYDSSHVVGVLGYQKELAPAKVLAGGVDDVERVQVCFLVKTASHINGRTEEIIQDPRAVFHGLGDEDGMIFLKHVRVVQRQHGVHLIRVHPAWVSDRFVTQSAVVGDRNAGLGL